MKSGSQEARIKACPDEIGKSRNKNQEPRIKNQILPGVSGRRERLDIFWSQIFHGSQKASLCTLFYVVTPSSYLLPNSLLCLNGCNHHRVENIVYGAASAEVIDWFIHSLKHRSNSHGTSFPLDCFISIIPGIQVRENQN